MGREMTLIEDDFGRSKSHKHIVFVVFEQFFKDENKEKADVSWRFFQTKIANMSWCLENKDCLDKEKFVKKFGWNLNESFEEVFENFKETFEDLQVFFWRTLNQNVKIPKKVTIEYR